MKGMGKGEDLYRQKKIGKITWAKSKALTKTQGHD